jgi:ABC-type lipoprotein release transport system permease subunit
LGWRLLRGRKLTQWVARLAALGVAVGTAAMLVVLAAILVVCLWIVLIAASAALAPERRIIDCSMASFHPDFTPAMREACRKR